MVGADGSCVGLDQGQGFREGYFSCLGGSCACCVGGGLRICADITLAIGNVVSIFNINTIIRLDRASSLT